MKEQKHVKYAQVYHLAKYIENDIAREDKSINIEDIKFHITPTYDAIQFDIYNTNVRFDIRFFNAYNYRKIMHRITEVKLRSERGK